MNSYLGVLSTVDQKTWFVTFSGLPSVWAQSATREDAQRQGVLALAARVKCEPDELTVNWLELPL